VKQLTLTKRLFWIITFFIFLANTVVIGYLYRQAHELTAIRAYSKAKTLHDYFISMRYVYHQQFLSSGIDLNDSTVGFLPAHASTHISEFFSQRSKQGITIRNVSDRPRNPDNKADDLEEKMIRYFDAHPKEDEKLELIEDTNGQSFYFFSSPLRIQAYCLACHGKKEEVLPYIAQRYDNAYGYSLGEVRGLTSIKMPKNLVFDDVIALFWKEVFFSVTATLFLLVVTFLAIKELTKREVEQKKELEALVKERTQKLLQKSDELEKAYDHQKHLYSVLRTVADSNQILITTQTLSELLQQTAQCLFENDSFAHVKIILWDEEKLSVKESLGLDGDFNITEIEEEVFRKGGYRILTHRDKAVGSSCQTMMHRYGVSEAYITALRSDKFARNVLGVLTICTTIPQGFSPEERAMIEELAGDVGFAINSFRQKESIIKLSYYDPLTDLANKTMLSEHIRLAIQAHQNSHMYGALLFLDIDNFKSINDLKGHATGDKLLVLMAERLKSFTRDNDVLARFGGDEFTVLLPNIADNVEATARSAEETAMKILIAAKEPFMIDQHPFFVTVSIGIGLFGEKESVESLLSHADSAMYAAKRDGRDTIRFFDAFIQHVMEEKSLMLQRLRDALDSEQFFLLYQPQLDHDRRIVGVEALVRLKTKDGNTISPAHFIPICEESGLIIPLGYWVMKEAISQAAKWKEDAEKSSWRISINVSIKQFEREDFIAILEAMLKENGIDPSRLRLELTESLLIGDSEKALKKINALKTLGVSLSIDDFGTGYSSLQYLKNFHVDELKIDQSFIRDFIHNRSDAMIVETILSMGQNFHLEVIAEGVETQEQFEALKRLGCRYFQGYLFAKPTAPELL